MDILKLLSRSTKQQPKVSSGKPGVSDVLPSAGTSDNPQLYHDVVESRGKKRKRGAEKVATQTEDQVQETDELNFFAPKITKVDRIRAPVTNEVEHTVKQAPVELLDSEECRLILRSHRLKVTRLAAQQTAEKKIKKSKKSKAAKKSEPAKNKELYPQPLQAFSDLQSTYNISPRLGENLAQQGYKIPTEVQMGSLPLLLDPTTALSASPDEDVVTKHSGIDLLAVAPTGSGKTLAFLIPVVDQIVQRRRKTTKKKDHILEAIVVAPTKELASQIVNEAKKLSIGTGVKILGMRKGTRIVAKESDENMDSPSEGEEDSGSDDDEKRTGQTQPLARADVLVTTPGLLLSALSLGSPDDYAPLPTVRTLVLDEADVLLDPLFRDQTLGIWNSCQNHELRVTLWSATMGSNIEALASSTMEERRKKLELERASPIIRLVVGLKDSAIPNITHRLTYAATEPGKLLALRQLLHPTAGSADGSKSLRPPFLVFTQTIPRAIALHSELLYDIPAEAGGSSRLAVLHSDLSDSARDHIMTRFRNGEIWVLITTDILSRGVDFRGINGVVNYDVPNSGASYIHRVGRTGRAGRNGGVAVTFYTQEDIPYVRNIATIIAASEKQAGKPASEASMQKWLLDALPKPSKEEKQKLKKYGVEARRGGLGAKDGKGRAKAQISTKSGYERRLEHNRKGAIQGSRRRIENEDSKVHSPEQGSDDDEWGGIDD